jgi:hypothetical protein
MKSNSAKLSVGFVGFLRHKTPESIEGAHNEPRANAGLAKNPQKPDSEPDKTPDILPGEPAAEDRAAWTRSVSPDSRHPLICDAVRVKIEAIEADARAKGWPAELLWSCAFWHSPRGLAALLDAGDEIGEVTPEYIEIWKLRRDRQRFMRCVA